MFISNSSIHDYDTRQQDLIHAPAARTSQARNCVRHFIPNIISETPACILEKFHTHSLHGFSLYVKNYYIGKYETYCYIQNCYICQH